MTEFTVYFTTTASSPGITVEAEDAEDAIDKAYESDALPSIGSICYQCSANFNIGGDWEPEEVAQDGKTVWSEKR